MKALPSEVKVTGKAVDRLLSPEKIKKDTLEGDDYSEDFIEEDSHLGITPPKKGATQDLQSEKSIEEESFIKSSVQLDKTQDDIEETKELGNMRRAIPSEEKIRQSSMRVIDPLRASANPTAGSVFNRTSFEDF